MKNFKKLSREELKNTFGGRACTLTFSDGRGGYITRSGTCQTQTRTVGVLGPDSPMPSSTTTSYCDIGDGVIYPLSSNGGTSRC